MTGNGQRKAALTTNPLSEVASYRADLGRGAVWTMGDGRFLVVTASSTPSWSFPAAEWIAADPALWKGVDRSP